MDYCAVQLQFHSEASGNGRDALIDEGPIDEDRVCDGNVAGRRRVACCCGDYERAAPAVLINRIGRRPYRSDSLPQIGEKMNCIAENEAMMTPMTKPCAPNERL